MKELFLPKKKNSTKSYYCTLQIHTYVHIFGLDSQAKSVLATEELIIILQLGFA